MSVKGELVHSPKAGKAYSATLPIKKGGQREVNSDATARGSARLIDRTIEVVNVDDRTFVRIDASLGSQHKRGAGYRMVHVDSSGVLNEAVESWHEVMSQTGALTGVARHHLIQSGLHTNLLKEVLNTFQDVSDDQLLTAIGLSTKTLSRRADSRLGPRHSDAAMALIEVTDMAQKVLGSRKLAEEWLTKPALALDGMRPLDLISTTPGIESVKDLLTRMEYGVYA